MAEGIILILILVIFIANLVILIFVLRYLNEKKKKGIQLKDEMTKMITQKSAAMAFVASWVLWLIVFVSEALIGEIRPNWMIFIGLMGMACIFIFTNVFTRYQMKKSGGQ